MVATLAREGPGPRGCSHNHQLTLKAKVEVEGETTVNERGNVLKADNIRRGDYSDKMRP